jgi:hypothetical protein
MAKRRLTMAKRVPFDPTAAYLNGLAVRLDAHAPSVRGYASSLRSQAAILEERALGLDGQGPSDHGYAFGNEG